MKDSVSDDVVTETTLLLPAPQSAQDTLRDEQLDGRSPQATLTRVSSEESAVAEDEEQPLPKFQIALLCFARVAEPIAFFSIFPIVNQAIYETGSVKEEDVGFYSGLIMIFLIAWGRAADRFGRKPVLIICLVGVAIGTAFFGFSTSPGQMIACRCFAGMFAGMIVTIRTMLSEISTRKTQARTFSFFAFAGNIGIFLGPLLGGGLAKPAQQFPSIFKGVHFFEEYPYALSTIVPAAFGLSAAVLNAMFLNETLDAETIKSGGDQNMSISQLLKSDGVLTVLYLYGHIMLLAFAYTAILPVFCFTDVRLGGLGFTPAQISLFLTIVGLSQALWTLIAFPILTRRYKNGGVLRGSCYVWVLFLASYPLENKLRAAGLNAVFWTVAITALAMGSSVAMTFTSIQLALNDIAPTPTTLGTLNALATSLVSGIRAVAPAAAASFYAASLRWNVLGGQLIWVTLVALVIVLRVVVGRLPEQVGGFKRSPAADQ